MIYMDVKEDLKPYALKDLHEMTAKYSKQLAATTNNRDLLVQLNIHDETHDKLYHLHQNQLKFQKSKDWKHFKDLDLGPFEKIIRQKKNTDNVFSFFDNQIKSYPSQHYMIIFWGHGKGWTHKDVHQSTLLNSHELLEVVLQVHQKSLASTKKIDHIIFDSCYMQSLELSLELSKYAQRLSASAQVQPYLGLPYRTFFFEMSKNYKRLKKKQDALEINNTSKVLPLLFKSSYSKLGLQAADKTAKNTLTFSSLDLNYLEKHGADALNNFAQTLLDYYSSLDKTIQDKLQANINSLLEEKNVIFKTHLYSYELGTFLRNLFTEITNNNDYPRNIEFKNLKKQLLKLEIHSKKTVLNYVAGDAYKKYNGFRALNFWLPRRHGEFDININKFLSSKLYLKNNKASSWHEMMNVIFKKELKDDVYF